MKKLLLFMGLLLMVCSSCQNETQVADWKLVALGVADYNFNENSLIIYNELPTQQLKQNSEKVDTLSSLPIDEHQIDLADKGDYSQKKSCGQNVSQQDSSKCEIYEVPKEVLNYRLRFGFNNVDRKVDWKYKVYLYRCEDYYVVSNLTYERYQNLARYSYLFADFDFYDSIQPLVICVIALVLVLIYLYGWLMIKKGNSKGSFIHNILWMCIIFGIFMNVFDGFAGLALSRDYPPKSIKSEEVYAPFLLHMRLAENLTSEQEFTYIWNVSTFSSDAEITPCDETVLIEGYNFWTMMLLRKFLRYTFFALILVFGFLNFVFTDTSKQNNEEPVAEGETT